MVCGDEQNSEWLVREEYRSSKMANHVEDDLWGGKERLKEERQAFYPAEWWLEERSSSSVSVGLTTHLPTSKATRFPPPSFVVEYFQNWDNQGTVSKLDHHTRQDVYLLKKGRTGSFDRYQYNYSSLLLKVMSAMTPTSPAIVGWDHPLLEDLPFFNRITPLIRYLLPSPAIKWG